MLTDDKDDDMHLQGAGQLRRVPVTIKMATRVKISVFCKFYFHKYYWNMMYPCQIKVFKLKSWIYTYMQQATRHHSEYKSRFWSLKWLAPSNGGSVLTGCRKLKV